MKPTIDNYSTNAYNHVRNFYDDCDKYSEETAFYFDFVNN